MARMRFDDAELMKVQQSLQSGLDELNKKRSAKRDHVHEMDAVSGSLSPEAQAEYEKKVIMESVARAKARCGLRGKTKEDTSVVFTSQEIRQDYQSKARYVLLPLEALCSEDIGLSERLVYLYICANCFNGKVNLSIYELANELHLSKSKVAAAIAALREMGWLTWEAPRSGKSRKNHYRPLMWLPDENVLKIVKLLKNSNMPNLGNLPNYGDIPKNGEYLNFGKSPQNGENLKIGNSPNSGNLPNIGNILDFGNSPNIGDMPKLGHSVKSLANTASVGDTPDSSMLPNYGNSPNSGEMSENGNYPENGNRPNSGDIPNLSNSEQSLATSGFVDDIPKNSDILKFGNIPENGELPNFGDMRKIVDTTEFRQDLVRILREVKIRDLKDLKDLKILKDLKDNKNKISDFVDNLCITFVDKSLVPEYLMTMFRIAFPDQSAEKLQVVRKLTERLQKGFAWYVVLLFLIKSSPYLMGKDKYSEGWKCTLTWALAADNYPKIMDLTYVKYGLRWTPHNFIEFLCRSLERGEY